MASEASLNHRRVHEAWQDGVTADALLCVLNGDGTTELDDRRLGCRVCRMRMTGISDARRGRHVDNHALAKGF